MAKLTDSELNSVLDNFMSTGVGPRFASSADRLARDRILAMRYYNGDPFGNEVAGRSQVVSHDVAEAIDGVMPSLLRPFVAGEQVLRLEPAEQSDEEAAQIRTDYINHVIMQTNDGLKNLYTFAKDGLLFRIGWLKCWWSTEKEQRKRAYDAVDEMQLAMLRSDEKNEILSAEPNPQQMGQVDPATGVAPQLPPTYKVTLRETFEKGVQYKPIPGDEMVYSSRATSIDDCEGFCHRPRVTASDLIEMGYSRQLVESLTAEGGEDTDNQERNERYSEEGLTDVSGPGIDKSMRKYRYEEFHILVDYDDDGIAEWRMVCRVGSTIIKNEEVDGHPFIAWTPIILSHKLTGKSMADDLTDVQLIKSTIQRQQLDEMYIRNAPRMVVTRGQVDLDSLLTVRPGGIVIENTPNSVRPLMPAPATMMDGIAQLEYMDSVKENRSGVTRYNQGLDANSLNKTATGVQIIQNASNQRIELMARLFGEAIKRLGRRINELLSKHQNVAVSFRRSRKWVSIDPGDWKSGQDLVVDVGLGTGDRQQQMMTMGHLLALDEKIITMQGGPNGPLVGLKELYNKLAKMVEFAGLKSADPYYIDPASARPQQPQQQPQDPAVIEAQAKAAVAMEQAKAQAAADKIKSDQQIAIMWDKARADMAIAAFKADEEAKIKSAQARHDEDIRERGAQMDEAHRAAKGNGSAAVKVNLPSDIGAAVAAAVADAARTAFSTMPPIRMQMPRMKRTPMRGPDGLITHTIDEPIDEPPPGMMQ